jgi:hypothetical protein
MARSYATVTVTARRGQHRPYRYVGAEGVRASRAPRVARELAREIAAHEGRSGMTTSVTEYRTGAVVTVGGCRFAVRAG